MRGSGEAAGVDGEFGEVGDIEGVKLYFQGCCG